MIYTQDQYIKLVAAALTGSLAAQQKDYPTNQYDVQSALVEALNGVTQGLQSAGYKPE